MKRVCIFVDGENFRHSIEGLFPGEFDKKDYLPKRARWAEFFDWIAYQACGAEAFRLRTYWYVIGEVDFFPWRFPSPHREETDLRRILHKDLATKERIAIANDPTAEMETIVAELKKQRESLLGRLNGWKALQNGISLKHNFIEFRRAGTISFNLFEKKFGDEKAVDVQLATDLITLRDIYDHAIIVSGDADYVPAVQYAKNCGKVVINVSFKTKNDKLLPGGARRLNQLTDKCLEVPYDRMRDFLAVDGAELPLGTE